MTKLSRRSMLQLSAAGLTASALPFPAMAQEIDELVIAYNVNLPSWDPTVGLSAVNPTIQGIYQSVFDLFIHQEPGSRLRPRHHHQIWLDRRSQQDPAGGARGRDLARRLAADAGRRGLVAGTRRQPRHRQARSSSSGARSATFAIDGNVITADVKEFEPTIFKWMAFLTGYVMPKAYYEKVGAGRFRGKTHRQRPLHGRQVRAQRLRAPESQPQLLGRQAGIRDRDHQVRDRRRQPASPRSNPAIPMSRWKCPMRNSTA